MEMVMNRNNLKLISQPAWKVLVVDFVARLLGVLVHIEGIPVGKKVIGLRPVFYRDNQP
jgi:hypothetical protein